MANCRNGGLDGQIAAAVSQSLNDPGQQYNTYQSIGQISNPDIGTNAESPPPPVEPKSKKRLNKWGDEIDED